MMCYAAFVIGNNFVMSVSLVEVWDLQSALPVDLFYRGYDR